MYVICVYDVYSKRCKQVMKVLKKYLYHAHRSVFEGEITPKKYDMLQDELAPIIKDDDEVIMYYSLSNKRPFVQVNGKDALPNNVLI